MMSLRISQLFKGTSSMMSAVQSLQQRTVPADKVAPVFRGRFIETGYRLPDQPWSYYWRSLFSVHNETANVWSHIVTTLLVLKQIWDVSHSVDYMNDKNGWTMLGCFLGCFLTTFLSAIAHQFHSKSIWLHHVLYMFDYGGVTLYDFGTGLGYSYISSQRGIYRVLEPFLFPVNMFLSWFTFYNCCQARLNSTTISARTRKMAVSYVSYAFLISIPVLARFIECLSTPDCSLSSLNHMTLPFVLMLSCMTMYASHVPERLVPGRFDTIGHSHFLFHLISMATLRMQMEGFKEDICAGAADHTTNPGPGTILAAFVVLISAQVLTVVYLRHDIDRRVKKDTDRWRDTLAKRT